MSRTRRRGKRRGASAQLASDSASVVYPMPPMDPQIRREAVDWYVALRRSDALELWPLFREWLDRDPHHRAAFGLIERFWGKQAELANGHLKH